MRVTEGQKGSGDLPSTFGVSPRKRSGAIRLLTTPWFSTQWASPLCGQWAVPTRGGGQCSAAPSLSPRAPESGSHRTTPAFPRESIRSPTLPRPEAVRVDIRPGPLDVLNPEGTSERAPSPWLVGLGAGGRANVVWCVCACQGVRESSGEELGQGGRQPAGFQTRALISVLRDSRPPTPGLAKPPRPGGPCSGVNAAGCWGSRKNLPSSGHTCPFFYPPLPPGQGRKHCPKHLPFSPGHWGGLGPQAGAEHRAGGCGPPTRGTLIKAKATSGHTVPSRSLCLHVPGTGVQA